MIAGAAQSTRGKVYVFGMEAKEALLTRVLGYCPVRLLQEDLSVEENVRVVGALRGLNAEYTIRYTLKLLRYFRLKGFEKMRVKNLSEIQKKKISLAVALIGFPKVLLFD